MSYKLFHSYKIYKNGDIQNKFGNSITSDYSTTIPTIKLSIEGNRVRYRLPNLILCVWKGLDIEAFKRHSVVYEDGNKYNNHLYNLRFDTTPVNRISLTQEQINEIKNIYNSNDHDEGFYVSYDDLSRMYNVSKGTIHNVLNDK